MTILKDKDTRESKGVAFVLFLDRQTAQKAVAAVNRKQVLIITIKRPHTPLKAASLKGHCHEDVAVCWPELLKYLTKNPFFNAKSLLNHREENILNDFSVEE